MKFTKDVRIQGEDFGVAIPAISIDGRLCDSLLGKGRALKDVQEQIDKTMTPASFAIPDIKISMGVYFDKEPLSASNLAAKIEGSDPELKKEVVIVGAHYDHMGKNNRGRFFPGADDDASGTAGVIELARAFSHLKVKPKRSLLFLLYTAEEKGLLGSRYYVENPIFPLDKTLAVVNMDMIGRNNIDQFSLLGRYQYPKLYQIVADINSSTANMEISFNAEGSLRSSDHMPFMRNNVPVIYLNTGFHDQYHRPEDTVDRLLPEKMEKIVRLVFLTLYRAADLPPGARLHNSGQGKTN